jgi:hypothetical protein
MESYYQSETERIILEVIDEGDLYRRLVAIKKETKK